MSKKNENHLSEGKEIFPLTLLLESGLDCFTKGGRFSAFSPQKKNHSLGRSQKLPSHNFTSLSDDTEGDIQLSDFITNSDLVHKPTKKKTKHSIVKEEDVDESIEDEVIEEKEKNKKVMERKSKRESTRKEEEDEVDDGTLTHTPGSTSAGQSQGASSLSSSHPPSYLLSLMMGGIYIYFD
jgi:hypothetical protein